MATALASADAAADLTIRPTIDHNTLSDYEGYCTWGAQEQIHDHTGYYIKALTGNAETGLTKPKRQTGQLSATRSPTKARNIEEAVVLSPKASLGKFGECRLIVARSWVERAWLALRPRPVQALTVLSPTALPAIARTR